MSKPRLPTKHELNTTQAQYIFRKLMKDLDSALFYVSVIFYNVDEEESMKICTTFENKIQVASSQLQAFISQKQDEFNEKDYLVCTYSENLTGSINLQTRLSNLYLDLLHLTDQAITYIDTFWLHGDIQDLDRHQKIREIQQMIFAIGLYALNERNEILKAKSEQEKLSDSNENQIVDVDSLKTDLEAEIDKQAS